MTSVTDPVRLLIVDDDLLFVQMLPRLLHKSFERPAFAIDTARGADEAKRKLLASRFDVLLCDFDLKTPLTGIDVLAEAAKLETPPIRVLVTGHSPRQVNAGPNAYDAFLDKPMTLRELVPLFAAILRDGGIDVTVREAPA